MNTLSILRIKLKLHFVHSLRLTQKLGKKGRFAKVSFHTGQPPRGSIRGINMLYCLRLYTESFLKNSRFSQGQSAGR